MPELPEVETIRRGLEAAVLGKSIKNVQINRHDLRVAVPEDFGQRVTGASIDALIRRGKYIIMQLAPNNVPVVLHLGMSGRIRIFESGEAYSPRKHDHLVFHMDDSTCFAFEDPRRFGMMYIASDDGWDNDKPFAQMGPEPLGVWSGQDLLAKLQNKKANIKSALLDQRVVAGLGNIYVCEALYYAGVHPERLSNTITSDEADKIAASSKRVLKKAIEAGGSTLRDYQHTDGSLGYFQHQFSVYDQKDKACTHKGCGGAIERIVQAGRSTFYCPVCQK